MARFTFYQGFAPIFFSDSAAYPPRLAGVEFFYENYVCYMVFCKNSSAENEFLFIDLTYSKHPSDVNKKFAKTLYASIS